MTNISINNNGYPRTREHKGKSIIDFPLNYVVLDIETTGLDPYYDEIIELSAIRGLTNCCGKGKMLTKDKLNCQNYNYNLSFYS